MNRSSAHDVHPAVRSLLLAAARESAQARGPERRSAFRTARFLLAGCRALGQPRIGIAHLLGVRAEAIASRDTVEGNVSTRTFARLAGITVGDIEGWQRRGDLPDPAIEITGETTYPAAALISVLVRQYPQP